MSSHTSSDDPRRVKWRWMSRRRIVLVIGIVLVIIFAGLPFFAGTRGYPIAIVDGNSMNPALHSGDLVIYAGTSAPIANGSIIIFVQSATGISALDALLKPTIIHRVIGIGREPSGI